MKINGIGIVKKSEAEKILTKEGRRMVKTGLITTQELGEMYKLEQVKKCSIIGSCQETFNNNYVRIPDTLKEKLSPEELASLVDAFYKCYSDGKSIK